MPTLNETHDPALTSWVESANVAGSDFPIQNLPLGVFRARGTTEVFRGGVAIGDHIVDLAAVHALDLFDGLAKEAIAAATGPTLNPLMALGRAHASALRHALSRALRTGAAEERDLGACLVPQAGAEYAVPANIGDYTDFYASIHHATNIGKLFRPDNPLLPNYQWIPIGYHGRSSSIGVSGDDVIRPVGQTRPAPGEAPGFGPSQRMDYELELGVYVGQGNALGETVPMAQAEAHLFGVSLLNDWSARDLQAWEYQPLGPFLAKSFASTVSPWIVTFDALTPYRVPWTRPADHPQPIAYLDSDENRSAGGIDLVLEVLIETPSMRQDGLRPERLSLGNFKHAYWTVAQMLTHHTSNGCNMRPGDLFGSGTMSGPEPGSEGALIEITAGGKNPITLTNGEKRTFLQDGDTVIMRAWCAREGAARIGLGEVRSTVLPAGTHHRG